MPAADAVSLFGENLKLSRITAVPQEHQRLWLILNFLTQIDAETPIVNVITTREIASESM